MTGDKMIRKTEGSGDMICGHSRRRAIIRGLSWGGMLFFLLSSISFVYIRSHLEAEGFMPSHLFIWLLILIFVIIAGFVSFLIYRRLESECIILNETGVCFTRKGREIWRHNYADIKEAKFETVIGTGGQMSREYARIILNNGLYENLPVGMEEPLSPIPIHKKQYMGKYLPFELLRQKKVRVTFDNRQYRSMNFRPYYGTITAVVLLGTAIFMYYMMFDLYRASMLICFSENEVETFSPPGLEGIRFSAAVVGDGGKIYLGTRRKGVLCFKEDSFETVGTGMPPSYIRALFFDRKNQRLKALVTPPFPHYDFKYDQYVLKNDTWHLIKKGVLTDIGAWYNRQAAGSGYYFLTKGLSVTDRNGTTWNLRGAAGLINRETGAVYRYQGAVDAQFLKFITLNNIILIGIFSEGEDGIEAEIVAFDPFEPEPFRPVTPKYPISSIAQFDFDIDNTGNIWTYREQ
jgi:hypothetical protein